MLVTLGPWLPPPDMENEVLATFMALAAGAAILIAFYGLNRILTADAEVEERLSVLIGRQRTVSRQRRNRAADGSITMVVDRAITKKGFGYNLARDLARANLKLTVTEYLIINLATMVIGAVAGFAVGHSSIIMAIVFGIIGYFVPMLYVKRRKGQRLKAFNDQLTDTITLLANSLRSGYSLLQSMDMVSREAVPPTSEEFNRVVKEVGLGLSPEEALGNLVRRIGSDDLDLVVTAINVQHEVGGNLAQILETIGHTIRERIRIKGEIQSLTAQQKYGGYVLSALPVFTAIVMFLINKDYILPLFDGIFICIPIVGVIMIIIGTLIIRKITNIEV